MPDEFAIEDAFLTAWSTGCGLAAAANHSSVSVEFATEVVRKYGLKPDEKIPENCNPEFLALIARRVVETPGHSVWRVAEQCFPNRMLQGKVVKKALAWVNQLHLLRNTEPVVADATDEEVARVRRMFVESRYCVTKLIRRFLSDNGPSSIS